jgi:outer membrane lipoprotein-sorting protein
VHLGRKPAALIAITALLTACPPPRVPKIDLSTLTDDVAVARVHKAASHRQRMAGTVHAKLPGVQGVVMSADLDVALEPPAMLSVAVRSFFEQPQQVLVTDGKTVSLYDATSGQPHFKHGPADGKSIEKLLGVPLLPDEVVAVFLAHPDDDAKGHLARVDEKAGTYTVTLQADGKAQADVTVRASDDAVVAWRQYRGDGSALVDVSYGELKPVGDAVMPFQWTLTLVDNKQAIELKATDVTFNGPRLPPDAFQLTPPGNVPWEPL